MFVLLLVLCLAGCGLFQSGEDKLKDLLEDKYGEKFGVESYYYAGDMWSMCYPLSDPTLLFEVRTDGEVTHIVHDYYLHTLQALTLISPQKPVHRRKDETSTAFPLRSTTASSLLLRPMKIPKSQSPLSAKASPRAQGFPQLLPKLLNIISVRATACRIIRLRMF